ncbi:MAG TPA: DUF3810 family protein [Blastocatellia bacterium]|nr:DUF3810 family protein [Blastocatellia bacterium]
MAACVLVLSASALAFIAPPPGVVELYYSTSVYPVIQSLLTAGSNQVGFALCDLILLAALGFLIVLAFLYSRRLSRAGRGNRIRVLAGLVVRLVVVSSAAYLGFVFLWGLNYSRRPLSAKLDFDRGRVDSNAVRALKRLSIDRLNEEYEGARTVDWPAEADWRVHLGDSFRDVVRELGSNATFRPGVPKRSFLTSYLGASGVTGFLNPFCGEVILDPGLLEFERPFTLAHEWAHLAGYADESEASFVGFLACIRSGSSAVRYSGWLSIYQQTPRLEPLDHDSAREQPQLRREVLADLQAARELAERRRNHLISRVQATVYDQFLKANRVSAGLASYGLLVELVAGTRFEDGWTPVRR